MPPSARQEAGGVDSCMIYVQLNVSVVSHSGVVTARTSQADMCGHSVALSDRLVHKAGEWAVVEHLRGIAWK